jgi:hypothetical protein
MTRLRAADDFAAIRARLEELRRDRAQVWAENASEVAESRRPRVAGNKPSPSEKPGLPPTIRRILFRSPAEASAE